MLRVTNPKVIKYLIKDDKMSEHTNITELEYDFVHKNICVYYDECVLGNYNLLPERRRKLQEYINKGE